jgi:Zn-dependent peptidase ImmA (M78 family)/DNA-binding transcriptional regulator YiaG
MTQNDEVEKALIPINPEILVWARTSLRLSVEEVSHKMGGASSVDVVKAWEKGDSSPTYPQLERLAHDIYKRPVAIFFFSRIPEEDNPVAEFRSLPENISSELPSEMIKLFRKAKLFQLNLEEIFEETKPVSNPLIDEISFDPNQIIYFCRLIRSSLGITIAEQCKWKSTETALKKWRKAFMAKGIFVFKDAFKNDKYSGFCLFHEKYPIIYINNSMPDSRQIFTLFHELGHLLLHTGGIDFRTTEPIQSLHSNYREFEIICNKFANEFLVPSDSFQPTKGQPDETIISSLAETFSVSREVILRKFLDRNIVNSDYYEVFATKWAEQTNKKKAEGSGGTYYNNQKTYLGEGYIDLVYTKYYQSKITLDKVSEFLDVKIRNLPGLEHVVMEGGKS